MQKLPTTIAALQSQGRTAARSEYDFREGGIRFNSSTLEGVEICKSKYSSSVLRQYSV